MPTILEEYALLFDRHHSGGRAVSFFLDPKLLPGPKTELRRQLLRALKGKPDDIVQTLVPLVRFLANFIDDYRRLESESPGLFSEINEIVRVGVANSPTMSKLSAILAGDIDELPDQWAVTVASQLSRVFDAYNADLQTLNNDLKSLGVKV